MTRPIKLKDEPISSVILNFEEVLVAVDDETNLGIGIALLWYLDDESKVFFFKYLFASCSVK